MLRITVFYLKLLLQEPFRFWEELRHGKDIDQHEPAYDPIFIIGHWRSGTSFMQYLLGRDPQFAYLNKFETVFPDVFLGSENFLKTLARRIPQTLQLVRDAQNMSIDLEW
ncbi:MAG TPA: sulfotransferase, partial [Balneolaceae bacterium]|nr:sulfotransferase [Balneolaceae bacterium]